jgi:hypothetical protein
MSDFLWAFALLLTVGLLYFAPAIIAVDRGHPSRAAVFVANLFFGWTLIGWGLVLLWALATIHEVPTLYGRRIQVPEQHFCNECGSELHSRLRPALRSSSRSGCGCGGRIVWESGAPDLA